VILFAIVWFAFQFFAQRSMFEWIGDRIDNITDEVDDESSNQSSYLPPLIR
jgi:hypothetical protein